MNKTLNEKTLNEKTLNEKTLNEKTLNEKIYLEEWYKKNKCLDKARLFGLCIKQAPNSPNSPLENKCKTLFDEWYKCILVEPHFKVNQIKMQI